MSTTDSASEKSRLNWFGRATPSRLRPILVLGFGLALFAGALLGSTYGWRWWTRTAPTLVALDVHKQFQAIDGWAVYPRYWEDDKENDRFARSVDDAAPMVSDYLVNSVGINSVRIELWSGLENPTDYWTPYYEGRVDYSEHARYRYEKINDDDDPYTLNLGGFQFAKFDHRMERMVLPILRAIRKNGEVPYVNVCYVDFKWSGKDLSGTLSHAERPEEFAEFVLTFFLRMRDKYGITPDAFEVILEPENTEKWRGKTIGAAILAVNKRLADNGFKPRIIAPSNTSMRNAIDYYDEMIAVPGVLPLLDTFAYHRYHVPLSFEVEQIWQRAKAAGIKTAMLEKVGAGIDDLIEDLTVGNVSAWQQWAAADREGDRDEGAYYARVSSNDGHSSVGMNRLTPQLALLFKHVRRGAVRISSTTNTTDKRSVAFRTPDGRIAAFVRGRRGGGQLTVRGLPPGRYQTKFVADDGTFAESELTVAAPPLESRLPRAGTLALLSVP